MAGFQKDLGITNDQYSTALTVTCACPSSLRSLSWQTSRVRHPWTARSDRADIAAELPCNLLLNRVGANILCANVAVASLTASLPLLVVAWGIGKQALKQRVADQRSEHGPGFRRRLSRTARGAILPVRLRRCGVADAYSGLTEGGLLPGLVLFLVRRS